MAKRLAGAGSRLALVDLDESALQATAEECRAAGSPQAQGYVANVAKEAEVEALFDTIAADFGAIHGLVNNAGIIRDALMLKYKDGKQVSRMTLDQWQAVIDVNLTAVFLCGREAAAKMIESGEKGCIVNISSISRSGNMGQANFDRAGLRQHGTRDVHETGSARKDDPTDPRRPPRRTGRDCAHGAVHPRERVRERPLYRS
jgi:3-oxoacyl-[acyl-carrier protein] reductase